MLTKARWPVAVIVGGIVLIVSGTRAVSMGHRESATDSGPKTIFTIGTENNLRDQFRESGFSGVQEFRCDATNCPVDQFPMRIYAKSVARIYDDTGVARLALSFRLSRAYAHAVLRLARWGVETDLVTVDSRTSVAVTAKMLGSEEDGHGDYDLNIGPLSKGRHTVGITVAEDTPGSSGRHSWDSLSLTVW